MLVSHFPHGHVRKAECIHNASDIGFRIDFEIAGQRCFTFLDARIVQRNIHDESGIMKSLPTAIIDEYIRKCEKDARREGIESAAEAIKTIQIEALACVAVAQFIASHGAMNS